MQALLPNRGRTPHARHARSPSAQALRRVRAPQPCRGLTAAPPGQTSVDKVQIKKQLSEALGKLSLIEALLPGSPQEKAVIDKLVSQLEQSGTSSAGVSGSYTDYLPGDWQLVYASNGTVITRTPVAQALAQISNWPGFGVSDIQQRLAPRDSNGALPAINQLILGFGPLGSWRLAIEGAFIPLAEAEGNVSQVKFSAVKLKPVGIFGVPLPDALPEVTLQRSVQAEWSTPYVDDDWRIGRGTRSGNTFLFRRMPPATQ